MVVLLVVNSVLSVDVPLFSSLALPVRKPYRLTRSDLSDSCFQGMSMSPLEAWEWRFSKSHPALVSTFSLLSSSWSSDPDLLLRRSPGSLCVGIWKLEKELPNDGLFSKNSTNKILQKMKWVNVYNRQVKSDIINGYWNREGIHWLKKRHFRKYIYRTDYEIWRPFIIHIRSLI